ncbi:hypothetical protein RFI_37902, partial [Reticulomyxa filosa]
CIINQIKIIQTQFNRLNLDNWKLINNRLNFLQYLCISTETLDVVIRCYKKNFKEHIGTCADLLCVISVKLNEQQLEDVITLFMDGLVHEDKYDHERCALSIAKIALKLNERQLNKVFKCLMNAFESRKIKICNKCAHALATISSQLGEKQLDNALQRLIHGFPSYFYNNEEQLGDVFQCLINGLSDENESKDNCRKCAQLLGKFSMKWNEKQLND